MNFKKFLISWVSIITVFAMLAGCVSPKSDNVKKSEDASDIALRDVVTNETVTIGLNNYTDITHSAGTTQATQTGYITSMESFMSIFGSLVDLSLYGQPYGTSYYMDIDVKYDLDFNIKLDDNTEFTLPVAVSEVINMGWELSSNPEVEGYYKISGPTMTDSKGKEIYPDAVNISSVTKNFSECYLIECSFNTPYHYDYWSSETRKYKGVDFIVCGSITKDSTIEDVISVLGAPSVAGFWAPESGDRGAIITLTYYQQGNPHEGIEFKFSGDFNRVLSVNYFYDSRKLVQ